MVEREFQFKIRLSADEATWLQELADSAGVTKTDFLRLILRRERGRHVPQSAAKTTSAPRRQKQTAKE